MVPNFFNMLYVILLQHDICNMFYLLLMHFLMIFIFLILSFSLHLFLDFFHCVRGKMHSLFFVYHFPSTMLLKAVLSVLVNSSIFSFPCIIYSSCILFSKFCKCSSQFVFVYGFPLLICFVSNIISCKIFSSFLFFYISIPIPNGSCLWIIF